MEGARGGEKEEGKGGGGGGKGGGGRGKQYDQRCWSPPYLSPIPPFLLVWPPWGKAHAGPEGEGGMCGCWRQRRLGRSSTWEQRGQGHPKQSAFHTALAGARPLGGA